MTRRTVERPKWCGQCDEDTRLLDMDCCATRCPRCHAATQPGGRHAPPVIRAPRTVAVELSLGDDA
jgi:hypothetical protein